MDLQVLEVVQVVLEFQTTSLVLWLHMLEEVAAVALAPQVVQVVLAVEEQEQ
jgi:hypothetical protein